MIRSTPPRLSILVATRNRSASLRRLLASLAASEPVPGGIGVVVVNDGSTDDTSPVVAASGARLVEGPHRGVAGALNAGWPLTVGERIIRLDDDVVLDPPALREMDLALDGADLVGATILPFGLGGAVAQFIQAEGLVDHRIIDGRARWLVGAACGVRREVLHEVGGWDAAFGRWNCGEDVDLTLRILAAGYRVAVAPKALVYHDHRGTLGQLVGVYHRNGTAQVMLARKHPSHRADNFGVAVGLLSPAAWCRTYRRYRAEASVPRSVAFLALRAAMLVPYAVGAARGRVGGAGPAVEAPAGRSDALRSSPNPDRLSRLEQLGACREAFANWPLVVLLSRLDHVAPAHRLRRLRARVVVVRPRTDAPMSARISDLWTVYRCYAVGEYDFRVVQWAEVNTVIDCGANIGAFARWATSRSRCEVVAVEPSASNLAVLRRNADSVAGRIRSVTTRAGRRPRAGASV